MKINAKLIEQLILQDYTLEQFAKLSGIHEMTLRKAINTGDISEPKAKLLADFWQCDVALLQPQKTKYSKEEMFNAINCAIDKYIGELEGEVETSYLLFAKRQISILQQASNRFIKRR